MLYYASGTNSTVLSSSNISHGDDILLITYENVDRDLQIPVRYDDEETFDSSFFLLKNDSLCVTRFSWMPLLFATAWKMYMNFAILWGKHTYMSTYLHSYYGFSQNSLLIVLKHIVLLFTSIWNDISVTFSFFLEKSLCTQVQCGKYNLKSKENSFPSFVTFISTF